MVELSATTGSSQKGCASCLLVVVVPGLGSKPCHLSSFDKSWRLVPVGLTREDSHLKGSSIFLYCARLNWVRPKGVPQRSLLALELLD